MHPSFRREEASEDAPPLAWAPTGDAGKLRRNSLYAIAGQLSVAALQVLQFLLVARRLGPHEFGLVASVTAITGALVPFSSLGLGNVAIMRIARGQGAPARLLGNALVATSWTGALCILAAFGIASVALGLSGVGQLVLVFGMADILVGKCVDVAAHIFYGLERQGTAALFYNLQLVMRVVFAGGLYLLPAPDALEWAALYCCASLISLGIVAWLTLRAIGRPGLDWRESMRDAKVGAFFSMGISGRALTTNVDKVVLVRSVSSEICGAYTAAHRIIYIAVMPVSAVLLALQARVFRAGHVAGFAGTIGILGRLALLGSIYCAMLGALLFGAAPLVRTVLGDAYALSSEVLQALCLLPLLLVLQGVAADALQGARGEKVVSTLYACSAGAAFILNTMLVPRYGWHGAVLAAYLLQGLLLAATLGSMLTLHVGRRRRALLEGNAS